MAYFRLSRGQVIYYLATRNGFRMSSAPSSNKGWKLHFFFISCHQGWSFPTEWTSWTVSSFVPKFSTDEIKLVEILQGILSISREMFNLYKMKSNGRAGSGSAASSTASAPAAGDAGVSTVEKHPSFDVKAGLRKHLWKAAAE
ncbi:hypothetical protein BHE74_00052036 [Ensete ventricosum]|nr:hypothetical protein BHE74_00052036 [Ensete ventricosum]